MGFQCRLSAGVSPDWSPNLLLHLVISLSLSLAHGFLSDNYFCFCFYIYTLDMDESLLLYYFVSAVGYNFLHFSLIIRFSVDLVFGIFLCFWELNGVPVSSQFRCVA